nr:hypothetical protein CFP56_09691 [Quercus suber]
MHDEQLDGVDTRPPGHVQRSSSYLYDVAQRLLQSPVAPWRSQSCRSVCSGSRHTLMRSKDLRIASHLIWIPCIGVDTRPSRLHPRSRLDPDVPDPVLSSRCRRERAGSVPQHYADVH